MKKLYFLLFTFFSLSTIYSQGSEDFTNSTATASYLDGSFVGNGGITWTYGHSRNEDIYAINGKGLMLRRASDSYLEATIPGGIGDFTFEYRKAFTGTTERQLELLVNGVAIATTATFGTISGEETTIYTFTHTVNQPGNVTIRIKNIGATTTNRQTTIDNISWTAFSGTPIPSLLITAPANATTFNPNTTSVDVVLSINNFNVANGTGDGHIHYTVNGGAVVMKYDTDPISIPVTPGNSYTVYVELVDNSHNPIAPAVNQTVTFDVADLTVVADLAALRADVELNGIGKYYQVSSNPIITFARPLANRNQKYIQDASAGILIDDLSGTISTPMVAGDAISGLKGQTSLFGGVLQLLPLENATVASSGNVITPQIVTAADIIANIETYESELVQINNASFTTADGVVAFATSQNYNLNDGTDIAFRTLFSEADYIGQIVPQGAGNRVVLVAEFNGVPQVVSRSLAEVTLSSSSFNAIEGLTMYPNPLKGNTLYLTSTANAAMSVQIFDVLGKEVLKSNVMNNAVSVSGLNAGVYIVKITEEGKTASRKLVIQ
ncbi:T9SS type A sorting domain-containing protein [Flavobacterium cucumis]|uniref:Por secretion system C-terminal sorting domain-containing protein n=1 Tax=Flavobacterium cucumis TaxID=416016 RepID=A0A1M7ZTH1_9FLAO|nr:T9SS type A sorting domain-containing protein [Flavobacterium cucumis]SHO72194.1 Por secretion system C-terminal sorting domain-containing protein [Flavobacterium cucumis]